MGLEAVRPPVGVQVGVGVHVGVGIFVQVVLGTDSASRTSGDGTLTMVLAIVASAEMAAAVVIVALAVVASAEMALVVSAGRLLVTTLIGRRL